MTQLSFPLPFLVAALLTSCASGPPIAIQHVVLIKLNDAGQAAALLEDCDTALPGIKGVLAYWSGTPDQSGRVSAAIDTDWDVALCVGYADAQAYTAYVDHPAHVELVRRWKPEFTWLRIHDVAVSKGN